MSQVAPPPGGEHSKNRFGAAPSAPRSSGGGVSNPTILDIAGDIETRGRFLASQENIAGQREARGAVGHALIAVDYEIGILLIPRCASTSIMQAIRSSGHQWRNVELHGYDPLDPTAEAF